MLTNRTLARINNRPRGIERRPLVVVGAGTLAMTALAALAFALGMAPYFVHDEEHDLFRFHDGRFAFSREQADWALLKKRRPRREP